MTGLVGAVKVHCAGGPAAPIEIHVAPRPCGACNSLSVVLFGGVCRPCLPELPPGAPVEKVYADFLHEHLPFLNIGDVTAVHFVEVGKVVIGGYAFC